ncbi:MAG: hypothetical protein QW806_05695 [Nitrososphaerota archaeon]
MNYKSKENKRHSRLFYICIVTFLTIGFIFFSIFMSTFSKNRGSISIPISFPIVAIIIFYEGIIRKRELSELGIKKENFWRNIGIGILLAFFGFFYNVCCSETYYS